MQAKRQLTYAAAIAEAFNIALSRDKRVFLIGEGIADPKGAFGTTTGLQKKYGKDRVMDMPVSENGMTGVCIGAAIAGMRPVLTHMRIDFSLYSFDQIVNTAAKWYYMFGGKQSVPIVIRMIIGRGWGQGPQHSQSLQALFAHIPGLKVVMPATAGDAKGLLLSAIEDPNPVIFIEHRWLHPIRGPVPSGYYTVPIGKARVMHRGSDLTIVSSSHMTIECMKAIFLINDAGRSIELVDVGSVKPLDDESILRSVRKTKKLLVVDSGWRFLGLAGEIIARVAEASAFLKLPPRRLTLRDIPAPTSHVLAESYYPSVADIAREIMEMTDVPIRKQQMILQIYRSQPHPPSDVPDSTYQGPF